MLMKVNGLSQGRMAKMCGFKDYHNVQIRLNRDGIGFDSALDMLNVMGYEVVIRENRTGRRREDEIIITEEDEV